VSVAGDTRLVTARLDLRPFARADVDALHAQWTHPDVRRYLWDGRVIARAEVADVVEESIASFARRGFGFWAIEARPARLLVGFAGLRSIAGSTDLELYYGLDRGHWGGGFATEAARGVLRYAFDELGLDRVLLRADAPNVASVEVMQRLGARWVRTDATGPFGATIVYVVTRTVEASPEATSVPRGRGRGGGFGSARE
jgi:ribosomal-protein-alanine N-acetyltransferase